MTLTLPKTCSMGSSNTGLVGTIGVIVLNADGTTNTARSTTGIYEIGGGCYGKQIVFDDNFNGSLKWDTGGGSPVYATEDYSYYANNPKVDNIPSNLADVPTATELNTDHGSGAWTPADVSALATASALSTHDGKLDTVKAKTDYIPSDLADVPTATELNTDHGSGSWVGTTAAAIASAVWDALKTDHIIAGSFGNHVGRKLLSVAKFLGLK